MRRVGDVRPQFISVWAVSVVALALLGGVNLVSASSASGLIAVVDAGGAASADAHQPHVFVRSVDDGAWFSTP